MASCTNKDISGFSSVFNGFSFWGQGFWSLLLHTACCCCATKKDIVGFMEFCAVCTILSTISTLTAFLLCAVPVINPLALHNAGDRRNAVPCAALGCMKFALVFLTLFFQRCNLHSDPTPLPACSSVPRFQLRSRPCELWRSPASGLHPTAHLVSAACNSCKPSYSRH